MGFNVEATIERKRSQTDQNIQIETSIPPVPITFDTLIDDQYSYVCPLTSLLKRTEGVPDELKIYKDNQLVQTIRMSTDSATTIYQQLIVGDERYMFIIGAADKKLYSIFR